MREFETTVTQRGQVTVPAEVRRLLGIKPHDRVTFVIENGQVRLKRPEYTFESVYGSVEPRNRPEDFKRIYREARNEHAERVMRKMRQE